MSPRSISTTHGDGECTAESSWLGGAGTDTLQACGPQLKPLSPGTYKSGIRALLLLH